MTLLLDADPETQDAGVQPRMRVRPAPRREPPFDDELPAPRLHLVGRYDQPLPFEAAHPPTHPTERPSANAQLPDPTAWGRRLLIGISETAAGRRPLQQLGALLSHSVANGLRNDFERHAQEGRRHWTSAAVVRSVRASEPADGVAELSATVQVAGRVRAVALRLEVRHGRWRCTRLQLG